MNSKYKAKRNREILLNYEAGQTYKELAWVYQVSEIRIRQIINKEINLRNMKPKKPKENKKFVTPLEIIPYEIGVRGKTRRQILIDFFIASLNECEKNKIDLEKINHITFNQEYKNHTREKVFFIYSFQD